MSFRPTDEADIEQQRRREAARLYRDRHHISNDDTISNFEDLSVIGGALETIEQVSRLQLIANNDISARTRNCCLDTLAHSSCSVLSNGLCRSTSGPFSHTLPSVVI